MKYKKISILILIAGLLIGLVLTFHRNSNANDGWQTESPTEVNMDNNVLNDLIKKMHKGDFGKFDGLVVIKDGKLIVDEYANGYNSRKVHTIQSDTKSITSLLIGIAKDKGKIKSENEKIMQYFNGFDIQNLDIKKKAITLKDLLTMRGGFDWDEFATPINGDNPVMKMNNSLDWLKTSINAPMIFNPGEDFQYNGGGVIILDHILAEATGMHADQYAKKYLFDPLGIKTYFWSKQFLLFGIPHTAGGLNLRPRDLAKIGQMVLNNGKWNGKQIVSEKWINESLKKQVDSVNLGITKAGYGYLWWIFSSENNAIEKCDIYTCMGSGGQYMFIIPQYNIVVVTTANEFDDRYTALEGGMNILNNYILKSVKNKSN